MDTDDAKCCADQLRCPVTEDRTHLLRTRTGGDVVILRDQFQKLIADTSPRKIGKMASFLEACYNSRSELVIDPGFQEAKKHR
jgi:hypothetical protein